VVWRTGSLGIRRLHREKGSITIDGISLTVARGRITSLKSLLSLYYEHTNIRDRKTGDAVNLEGDVLGKYVERIWNSAIRAPVESQLTVAGLPR